MSSFAEMKQYYFTKVDVELTVPRGNWNISFSQYWVPVSAIGDSDMWHFFSAIGDSDLWHCFLPSYFIEA
jgi:hypothetical protein